MHPVTPISSNAENISSPPPSKNENVPPAYVSPTYSTVNTNIPYTLLDDDFMLIGNKISILHLNIQGLLGSFKSVSTDVGSHSKLDFLRHMLINAPPTIFCLSETKLSNKIDNSELSIAGYEVFRNDRTRNGGGVAVYCRSTFNPSVLSFPPDLISTKLESLTLKVSPPGFKPFIVCSIYRPPKLPVAWVRDFHALLNWLLLQKQESVIVGDFNVDLMTNQDFASEIKLSFNISQHVSLPTRITFSTSTLIDHLYSTSTDMISNSGVCELHLSDHMAIYGILTSVNYHRSANSGYKRLIEYRNLAKLDISKLTTDLASAPWSVLDISDDVNDKLDSFLHIFLDIWNTHAPIVSRCGRTCPTPWMNNLVLNLIHKRDLAYRTFLRMRTDVAKMLYKQLRNQTVKAIRNAKRTFFIQSARAGPRQFWRNIKLCTGFGKAKSFRTPWPCANVKSATSSANLLNNHFILSINNIIDNLPKSTDPTSSNSIDTSNDSITSTFSFHTITASEVEETIDSLSSTASTGSDNISTKMIKLSCKAVSHILADIFNCSLTSGIFPQKWKDAVVIPVFKKGDVNIMDNYRPIALLPVLSKVFEKIIVAQLVKFVEDSSTLSPSQFGFRQGLSTEKALLRLSKLLFSSKQSGMFSAMCTIDLRRAFDCLNHQVMLKNLTKYGFSCSAVNWFRSYLSGRFQRTRYANALSEPLPINYGVPEGSVTGPHLFNLYINSLLQSLPEESTVAYADDITLVTKGNTADEAASNMQALLSTIDKWAVTNLMSINTSKCFFMLIVPYVRNNTIIASQGVSLNNVPLQSVTDLRILGVKFQNNLSWVAHADDVRLKMNRMIGVVKRCGKTVNYDIRRKVYKSFIAPHLNYCLPVWGHLPKVSAVKMNNCLLRMLRTILLESSATFSPNAYELIDIQEFSNAVAFRCSSCISHALRQGICENYLLLDNAALPKSQMSLRSTGANKLYTVQSKRKCDSYCFQQTAASVWNNLPNCITSITDSKQFIKCLKSHFLKLNMQ